MLVLHVIQLAHAQAIPGTEQLPPVCIPDRKGKIAQQVIDAALTPVAVGTQDKFRIRSLVQADIFRDTNESSLLSRIYRPGRQAGFRIGLHR